MSVSIQRSIGAKETQIVRVTGTMGVTLVDPDPDRAFSIVSIGGSTQGVDKEGYTEWQWNVCAKRSGEHTLSLVVAIVRGGNKKESVWQSSIRVRNNEVVVIKGFWETNWQWLISSLIVPILVWLWKRKKG